VLREFETIEGSADVKVTDVPVDVPVKVADQKI
jgi:hypothetical protein